MSSTVYQRVDFLPRARGCLVNRSIFTIVYYNTESPRVPERPKTQTRRPLLYFCKKKIPLHFLRSSVFISFLSRERIVFTLKINGSITNTVINVVDPDSE